MVSQNLEEDSLWKIAMCFLRSLYASFLQRKNSCSTGKLEIKQETRLLLVWDVRGWSLGLPRIAEN